MPAISVTTNANGWQEMSLGEFCEIYQPKTISRKQMIEDGEYPVFGANGVIGRYSEYNHENSELLIACRGTCGSVNLSLPKSWITGNAMVVRPDEALVLRRFLEYAFQGPIDLSSVITGTAQPQITRTNLSPVRFAFPPLSEQQRIVSILDEAFERISNSEKNSQSELNAASELLVSHCNSIFENPSTSWRDTILEEISERVCVGFVGSTSKHYRDDGILFLRTKNVGLTGEVNLDDVKYITKEFHDSTKKSQLKSGDVILSRVVTDRINCAFIPEKFPEANCANVVIVRPGLDLDSRFLVYYIKSRTSQNYLLSKRKGSAQLVVNTTIVKQWPVKIPPLEVQQQIVRELDVMVQQISELMEISQNKSKHYLNLKQSILQEAFSGTL
jgi:type I restriction enzyme S subunit